MTFIPATPLGGYAGWRVFERIAPRQIEVHSAQSDIKRDVSYFRERLPEATTASALTNDRRLLKVALTAFGLGEEIDKRALITRVLNEGTSAEGAFALRLSDSRWRDFADAFSYGNPGGAPVDSTAFRERVVAQYIERSFEERVGEADTDIRLALNFRRDATKIANEENADRVGWFRLLGQQPLRLVLEGALSIPESAGTLDIQRQKTLFEDRFRSIFGEASPASLRDPKVLERVLQRYFLNVQLQNGPSLTTPGAAAVTLLSSGSLTAGLLLSGQTP